MSVSHLCFEYMQMCMYVCVFKFVREFRNSFPYNSIPQSIFCAFSFCCCCVFHSCTANCFLALSSWKIAHGRNGSKWSITFCKLDLLQVLLARTALFQFLLCLINIRILAYMRCCYCRKSPTRVYTYIYIIYNYGRYTGSYLKIN